MSSGVVLIGAVSIPVLSLFTKKKITSTHADGKQSLGIVTWHLGFPSSFL